MTGPEGEAQYLPRRKLRPGLSTIDGVAGVEGRATRLHAVHPAGWTVNGVHPVPALVEMLPMLEEVAAEVCGTGAAPHSCDSPLARDLTAYPLGSPPRELYQLGMQVTQTRLGALREMVIATHRSLATPPVLPVAAAQTARAGIELAALIQYLLDPGAARPRLLARMTAAWLSSLTSAAADELPLARDLDDQVHRLIGLATASGLGVVYSKSGDTVSGLDPYDGGKAEPLGLRVTSVIASMSDHLAGPYGMLSALAHGRALHLQSTLQDDDSELHMFADPGLMAEAARGGFAAGYGGLNAWLGHLGRRPADWRSLWESFVDASDCAQGSLEELLETSPADDRVEGPPTPAAIVP